MSSSFTVQNSTLLNTDYIIPTDPSERYLKLRQYLNDISRATNNKDSGIYDTSITLAGQQFAPLFSDDQSSNAIFRTVLRKVINTGALANNATTSIAHGISTQETFSLVRMYGSATDPGASTWTEVLPLPYSSPTLADNIELNADATNINIITGSDRTSFTRSFVVIEWITTV